MKEHKTLKDGFVWVPPDKRPSRFGGSLPPRNPETRLPVLWLARDGNDLYLVNNSKEPLDNVIADSGGFVTSDDDVIMASNENTYEYKNVSHNDAVKIEEYDGFYDFDYLLWVRIKVQSPTSGCIKITSLPIKGGIGEAVILWDSGEPGKNFSIEKCQ